MSATVVRLAVRCPKCGSPPRLRTVPNAHRILLGDPDDLFLSYKCSRKSRDGSLCDEPYDIRIKHFQEAG